MSYIAWSVIAGETPTATKWNELGGNDADFESRLGFLEEIPVTSTASDATPNPDASHVKNIYELTVLAASAVFAAPTGSPNDGDVLIVRIKDNGSPQALSWNGVYRAIADLPSTTTASKILYIGFIYNAADSVWDCVSVIEQS